MLFFHWKDWLPIRWWLFGLSLGASYALVGLPHAVYIPPIFLTYCTVFLGVAGLPEFAWLRTRDYSYGIYLYGFPIIQALIAAFPILRYDALSTGVLASVSTLLFAAFSWHTIERRALTLKNQLPKRLFPAGARPPPGVATAPTDIPEPGRSTDGLAEGRPGDATGTPAMGKSSTI